MFQCLGIIIKSWGVRLAQKFEQLMQTDSRFEIPAKRHLGMVVFRLIGDNVITETLWKRLNSRGNIHCVPAILKGKYVIRFTVTSQRTTNEDIVKDWKEIKNVATSVLDDYQTPTGRAKVPLADTKERNEQFGTSLLLSNSPMSPKIVNGSFAAIYDQSDVIAEFSKTIRLRKDAQNSPGVKFHPPRLEDLIDSKISAMRRRIKGILMSGKQFSLDSRLDLFHGIEPEILSPKGNTNNLPPLEDEETSEGEFSDLMEDLLSVPCHKQKRSKSVDHQVPIAMPNGGEKVCTKCGHNIIRQN